MGGMHIMHFHLYTPHDFFLYIENERRALIIEYLVDGRRAFNYSKEPKRYRPYEIAKDAYDINYYNYGFQMKEV